MSAGINRHTLLAHLTTKKQKYLVRITTQLRGKTKDFFLEDCVRKGVREAELARDIIEHYYRIIKQQPYLVDQPMNGLKTTLNGIVKFK